MLQLQQLLHLVQLLHWLPTLLLEGKCLSNTLLLCPNNVKSATESGMGGTIARSDDKPPPVARVIAICRKSKWATHSS